MTGRAGIGESTVIRRFLADTNRIAITVSPTGVAACNVAGDTIRRLCSIPATGRCWTSLVGGLLGRDVLPRDRKSDVLVWRFLEGAKPGPAKPGRATPGAPTHASGLSSQGRP